MLETAKRDLAYVRDHPLTTLRMDGCDSQGRPNMVKWDWAVEHNERTVVLAEARVREYEA